MKFFRPIDVIVIIIIAAVVLWMFIPIPPREFRTRAYRVVCGTHLKAIYDGLLTYANEYNDDYPRAGGRGAVWGATKQWDAPDEQSAFGKDSKSATIGASLYLLVKYAYVEPKVFLCKGDAGSKVFELSDYKNNLVKQDLRLAWDFGPTNTTTGSPPALHYSYAYATPYLGAAQALYAPSTSRQPGFAIMADRSPYFVLKLDDSKNPKNPVYEFTSGQDKTKEQWGDSPNHQREGQNVLFNNGSVSFYQVPYCGLKGDNIYTMDSTGNPAVGSLPKGLFDANALPRNDTDSVLLNEGIPQGSIVDK